MLASFSRGRRKDSSWMMVKERESMVHEVYNMGGGFTLVHILLKRTMFRGLLVTRGSVGEISLEMPQD